MCRVSGAAGGGPGRPWPSERLSHVEGIEPPTRSDHTDTASTARRQLSCATRRTSRSSWAVPAPTGARAAGDGGFFWRMPPADAAIEVFNADVHGEQAVHGRCAPWLAVVWRRRQSPTPVDLGVRARRPGDGSRSVVCAGDPGVGIRACVRPRAGAATRRGRTSPCARARGRRPPRTGRDPSHDRCRAGGVDGWRPTLTRVRREDDDA